jgi:hypothetical protein
LSDPEFMRRPYIRLLVPSPLLPGSSVLDAFGACEIYPTNRGHRQEHHNVVPESAVTNFGTIDANAYWPISPPVVSQGST